MIIFFRKGVFLMLEQHPKSAAYTLQVPVMGAKNLRLDFSRSWEESGLYKSLDGFTYSFNGRTYRDVESLLGEPCREISKNVTIHRDIWGGNVLCAYTSIPTFDSGDREWDSKMLECLFFDGKEIHLVILRGGYRIAKLIFYSPLRGADLRLKPLFEELGWSTQTLSWLE